MYTVLAQMVSAWVCIVKQSAPLPRIIELYQQWLYRRMKEYSTYIFVKTKKNKYTKCALGIEFVFWSAYLNQILQPHAAIKGFF